MAERAHGVPVTYVPARNTVFLALALGLAEVVGARDIFIGVNAVDYSGYPDCRPDFLRAFEALARLATKAGVEGEAFRIHAPLLALSKADIVRTGMRLGVDYALTTSCYAPDETGAACGRCDSCLIRAEGFRAAGVSGPDAVRASVSPPLFFLLLSGRLARAGLGGRLTAKSLGLWWSCATRRADNFFQQRPLPQGGALPLAASGGGAPGPCGRGAGPDRATG